MTSVKKWTVVSTLLGARLYGHEKWGLYVIFAGFLSILETFFLYTYILINVKILRLVYDILGCKFLENVGNRAHSEFDCRKQGY